MSRRKPVALAVAGLVLALAVEIDRMRRCNRCR